VRKLSILFTIAIVLILPLVGCATGYTQAELNEAYEHGYAMGHDDACDIAYESGYDDGYIDGDAEGRERGYEQGRDASYKECCAYYGIEEDQKYKGSTESDIYHYPWCIAAQNINPENEIWFDSPEDALAQGYRPCEVCRPPE